MLFFFSKKLDMITKEKMYEIDMHWLMLTDVKHVKKSVLCIQGSFVRYSLMPPMSKQRI